MKRNILMSLVLVLMVGLLCGCGGSKEKTNNNSNNNGSNGSNNSVVEKTLSTGTYVNTDHLDLEGIVVVNEDDQYTILVKDLNGTYVDFVSKDEVKNGKLTSELVGDEYSLEMNGNDLIYNYPILLIENKKLVKSSGAYDGVYESDSRYIFVFTLKSGAVRVYTFNKSTSEYYILKADSASISGNGFSMRVNETDEKVTISKTGDGYNFKYTGDGLAWTNSNGNYSLIK